MCADCLRTEAEDGRRGRGGGWWRVVPWAAAMQWVWAGVVLWGLFYGVTWLLARLPAEVHEGFIWGAS